MNTDLRNGVLSVLAALFLTWLSIGLLGTALRGGEIIQIPQGLVLALDYFFVAATALLALLSADYGRKFFAGWLDALAHSLD